MNTSDPMINLILIGKAMAAHVVNWFYGRQDLSNICAVDFLVNKARIINWTVRKIEAG